MSSALSSEIVSVFRELGVKRSAMSLITGRCGSTLLGEACRQLRFGDGVETLNALAIGQIQPHERDRILKLIRPAVVDGIFYHQTTYHRWKTLSAFVPPEILGEEITLIFRRNVIAQAISYVNAIATGKWHSTQVGAAPTAMTVAEEVERGLQFVQQIVNAEKSIRKELPNAPVFYYEDIVASPLETMHRFMSHHRHPVSIRDIAVALGSSRITSKLVRDGYAEQYERLFKALPGAADLLWSRFNV